MWAVSARYMTRYRESKVRHFRLVVLDPTTLSENSVLQVESAVVMEGSITAEAGLFERTCQLRALWTDVTSDPIGMVMRVDCGFSLPGIGGAAAEVEWVPMIVMVVDDLEVDFTAANATVDMRGRDRISFMGETVFGSVWTASPGDSVGAVIRRICEDGGMGTNDQLYDIQDGNRVLSTDFKAEEDDSRGDAVQQLMNDHSLTVRCRPNGVVEIRPFVEATSRPVAVVIESGESGTLVTGTMAYTQKGRFNRVIVVGEAPDMDPVRAEARDLDPLSPTYNPTDGSGPSGDRVAPIERSSDIRNYDQAYERAKQLLEEYTLVSEVITLTAVSLPALDINDRITVFNKETNLSYDLTVDQVAWPLGVGLMTVSGRRVRALFPA